MKCKYSLSFEFDTQPPVTERGEVEASSLRTIVARAIDDAISRQSNMQWSSVVVVVERIK